MVWIHGGGFYMGSGNTQINGPDYLLAADVVVVTLNYRLGALGKGHLYLGQDIDQPKDIKHMVQHCILVTSVIICQF